MAKGILKFTAGNQFGCDSLELDVTPKEIMEILKEFGISGKEAVNTVVEVNNAINSMGDNNEATGQ